MTDKDSYFQFVQERFTDVVGVTYKKMFGGMGLYKNGVVFGMIIQGELYFKVDDTNREEFESRKSVPFVYQSRGKNVQLPYYKLPEEILESPEELNAWVDISYHVSLNKKKKK